MTKKVKIDIVAQDKTRKAIESSKQNLGGLKKFALAASAALATIGAGRVITNLVNVGKEVESLQVRFKFLFGSADEGSKAFDNLANFASRVPFSLQEISAASGNLAVVSKDASELSKILEITGNVAAVTGLDFQTTASQIQRAFSGGIAAADVFREKGVRSLLGFEQGAKVSIDQTIERFEEVFGQGGRFGNATDELANTFEGTVSMLGDKFFKLQNDINKSFFTELKVQFGDLNTFLANNEDEIAQFGKEIGEALATAVRFTADAVLFLRDNADLLKAALIAIVAVKVASFMYGIATAISVANIRMMALNATMRKNLIFLAATGVVFGIQKVVDALGLFGDEVVENTLDQNGYNDSLREFDRQLQNQKQSLAEATEAQVSLGAVTEDLSDTYEFLAQKNTMSKPYQDLTASVDQAISSVEALTFAQQKVTKGFEDQKASSREAHKVEVEGVKSRKEGLEETGRALKKFTQAGAARSKKMFRLNQAVAIGEAIMNTFAGANLALKTLPPPFSFAVAGLTVATGLANVAAIRSQQPPAMFGGSRQQGTPFLVGERGPELFTPATAGTVTPNHQLPSGGNVVNFNITTVDAQSFGALLDTRRGQIVNMINTALNNKGQAALV
tara:strand:- start:3200 stop:5059 length:1860 start_codon:yes stop_codon:yes gene_type:complete